MTKLIKVLRFLLVLPLAIAPSLLEAKSYVIGKLIGQLGNQMFIIAATTSLALDNGAIPVFPDLTNPSQPDFNIPHNYQKFFGHLNTKNPSLKKKRLYSEPHFHYRPIPYKKNITLSGYFQSEKYFIKNKQKIIDLFSPSPQIISYLEGKYQDIIDQPNTVSIHMRSYLKEDPGGGYHITYGISYFQKAMSLFPEDTLFVVFSNDMDKCKKEFVNIPRNLRFIEGEDYIDDFFLMSMCKHNIISNSSFSWWAAYLNRNPEKMIVAPLPWFGPNAKLNTKDLIPDGWHIIHN